MRRGARQDSVWRGRASREPVARGEILFGGAEAYGDSLAHGHHVEGSAKQRASGEGAALDRKACQAFREFFQAGGGQDGVVQAGGAGPLDFDLAPAPGRRWRAVNPGRCVGAKGGRQHGQGGGGREGCGHGVAGMKGGADGIFEETDAFEEADEAGVEARFGSVAGRDAVRLAAAHPQHGRTGTDNPTGAAIAFMPVHDGGSQGPARRYRLRSNSIFLLSPYRRLSFASW